MQICRVVSYLKNIWNKKRTVAGQGLSSCGFEDAKESGEISVDGWNALVAWALERMGKE